MGLANAGLYVCTISTYDTIQRLCPVHLIATIRANEWAVPYCRQAVEVNELCLPANGSERSYIHTEYVHTSYVLSSPKYYSTDYANLTYYSI